jgi:transmembrane sensor
MMDKHSRVIAERAADYFAQRVSETLAQRREREAWLAEDIRHAQAYEDVRRIWERADSLRENPTLLALKGADMAALQRTHWYPASRIFMVAAVLLLVVLGSIGFMRRFLDAPSAHAYSTEVGERRAETLSDGSQVVLNTDSAMETRYSRDRRDVELERGEAQFTVTHDAARPFVVHAGNGSITALGTRFQVRRERNATIVTLLEGKVNVAQGDNQRTLQPNEEARLATDNIAVRVIDPVQVSGWLDGWLRFRDEALGEVVVEANRYSRRKLRLADAKIAGLKINGNFHAGDNASIASAIEQILPVRIEDRSGDIVLHAK